MRFRGLMHLALAAAVVALPSLGAAQTIGERVDAIEKKLEGGIGTALGIDIHALVALDYQYSLNHPDSDKIEYRFFDADSRSFFLNDVALFFSRQKEDEDLGFVVNVDFGKTAEAAGGITFWKNDSNKNNLADDSSENDNSVELREAYLTYKLPVGDGIVLKGGKFVSLLGYEIMKTYSAFNANITNSIMFGYAIPLTHTGLLLSVPLGDMFAMDVGVINGWDNVTDNNDSKSLIAGFKIAPADIITMYIAGTYGAEQTDNGHSKRGMMTANATLTPLDMLTLALDLNYGNDTDTLPHRSTSGGRRSAEWWGAAAYATVGITEDLSFNLRTEYFNDPDGVRSGFTAPGRAPGVGVWEVTPTIAYQVTKGLLARMEYRHDEADQPFFGKGARFQSGSDTVAGELLYAF